MADHTAESCITLHSHSRPVRILDGENLIADTFNAIELRERSYPPRPEFQIEIPRAAVDMSQLLVSLTFIHCPFKGDTTYYSLPDTADVIGSYERSVDEVQAIAERLVFDEDKVKECVELCPLSTQTGHAVKGSRRVYLCYVAVSMEMHREINGFVGRYTNIERARSFKSINERSV